MMRVIAFAVVAVSALPAAELPDHVLHLAQVKARVQQSLKTMPDYTCLVVTQRSEQGLLDPAPRPVDVVRLEVAHSGGMDLYAWPGAERFETSSAAELIGAGMYSSGEFATHLDSIFGGYTVMKYAGEERVLGRKLWRWDFGLKQVFARWTVTYASRNAVAGEKGSFWADPATFDVVRLEIHSDDLPPNFPISQVDTTIDYARVRLGPGDVLLPQSAQTISTEGFSGKQSQNYIEFSHCRQYVTKSEVRYDAAAPSEPSLASSVASGVKELSVPPNLRVSLALTSDIDSANAAVGDLIEAVVTSGVAQKKQIVIPNGATLRGRLRRMDMEAGPPRHFVIGLEFMDLEFPGYHARFFARLDRVESPLPGLRWLVDSPMRIRKEKTGHGIDVITAGTAYRTPRVPGVGIFFMEGASFHLPKQLAMTWITEDVSRK